MKKRLLIAVVVALVLYPLGQQAMRRLRPVSARENAAATAESLSLLTQTGAVSALPPSTPGRPSAAAPVTVVPAPRSSHQGPAHPSPSSTAATPMHSTPADTIPPAWPSLAPNVAASETDMVFMVVRMQDGRATLLEQAVVSGNMRPSETFAPDRGVYYRVLSATGAMLAQGLLPDPRLVHHDEPVPGGLGRLQGGVVMLPSAEVNVRFPRIDAMDSIELFLVDEATDIRRLTAASKECCGSFKITARAR